MIQWLTLNIVLFNGIWPKTKGLASRDHFEREIKLACHPPPCRCTYIGPPCPIVSSGPKAWGTLEKRSRGRHIANSLWMPKTKCERIENEPKTNTGAPNSEGSIDGTAKNSLHLLHLCLRPSETWRTMDGQALDNCPVSRESTAMTTKTRQ